MRTFEREDVWRTVDLLRDSGGQVIYFKLMVKSKARDPRLGSKNQGFLPISRHICLGY